MVHLLTNTVSFGKKMDRVLNIKNLHEKLYPINFGMT